MNKLIEKIIKIKYDKFVEKLLIKNKVKCHKDDFLSEQKLISIGDPFFVISDKMCDINCTIYFVERKICTDISITNWNWSNGVNIRVNSFYPLWSIYKTEEEANKELTKMLAKKNHRHVDAIMEDNIKA